MKMIHSALLVLIVLGSAACHKDHKITVTNTTDSCSVLDTLPVADTTSYTDGFRILKDSVAGDDLKLTVSYGGGCASHDFRLVWNQYSMAPFLVIALQHNAHGDECKALITRNICFNISRLKKGLTSPGQLSFPLSDTYGSRFTVTYKY